MAQPRGTTTLLAVVAVATAALLVASTGAVVLDVPGDEIGEEVALHPGENPYTYLDDDGELRIDVTEDNPDIDVGGVNPNTLTAVDPLFYITYDGDEYAEAWITHDAPAVTFTVDGEPIDSEANATMLVPEEGEDRIRVPVGVAVDTRIVDATPGDRLLDSIDVHTNVAEPEAATGGSGGSSGPAAPVVSVDAPDDATREVDVSAATAGSETSIDLGGMFLGEPWIRLDELSFVPKTSGDRSFTVAGSTDHPAGTDPVDRPGVDPLAYYTVTFDDPDPRIEETTARLSVDRESLDERGIDPGRLVVYHETDDGWEPLATTVAADGDTVRMTAESDGFSAFAVAVESPALEPVGTTIEPTEADPGEELTLDVELTNVGPVPATDAELVVRSTDDVDAEDVEAEDVENDSMPATADVVSGGAFSVDAEPGATATATVNLAVEEPGVHDLVIDGDAVAEPTTVATVTVTEPSDALDSDEASGPDSAVEADSVAETDETAASGTDEDPDEPASLAFAEFAGLLALLAIVLVTHHLARRMPR